MLLRYNGRPPSIGASEVTLAIESAENRVVRWIISADNASLKRDADIVTGIPYGYEKYGGRNGGRIRFGPDGYLYIATGDGDDAKNAQSARSLGGKVLRVDRDGNPAPDNKVPLDFDQRIYTYGHRNPQGIAFRPSDGRAFSVEHGDDTDDVLKMVAGSNYGWGSAGRMTDLTKFPDARQAAWSSGLSTLAPSGATSIRQYLQGTGASRRHPLEAS
jgi:glucose/arabinose dehydrogenase